MAKVPFRFFRGELNGAYIRSYLLSRNTAVRDIIEELLYHGLKVWKLESEVTGGEVPIRFEELAGMAMFAGVQRPVQYLENTLGSIKFTKSSVVLGVERSERGLFNMDREAFDIVRTAQNEYADDITTLRTMTRRPSYIPEGAVPVGYIAEGTTVFNEDGSIIPGAILSTPPVGVAYVDYYGPEYLHFEETFKDNVEMDEAAFKLYYESITEMRVSGPSIQGLLSVTRSLCEDYVMDIEVQYIGPHYSLLYSLDPDTEIDNRSGRFAAWYAVVEKRFKDFVITERII